MTIDKLIVFSETGDKNTDGLILEQGFPSKLQPARQWHNWLFNKITLKINSVIDELADLDTNKVDFTDIIDNLESDDASKPLSAKMGEKLNTDKLNKSDLATGDAPVFACRAWGNINGITGTLRHGGNIASVSFTGADCSVEFTKKMPHADYSIVTCCSARGDGSQIGIISQADTGFVVRGNYGGDNTTGSFIPNTLTFSIFC